MDRTARALAIEAAAYRVLNKKGFKGTSMLEVARAAKASNETLYKWYGDKIGLFKSMIERNAAQVEETLHDVQKGEHSGSESLKAVANAVLAMLTGSQAIALNRAAAADASGVLGRALSENGRARVLPLIRALIDALYEGAEGNAERVEVFITLVVGDLQIRRAIGVLPPLTKAELRSRSERAVRQFETLYGAPGV